MDKYRKDRQDRRRRKRPSDVKLPDIGEKVRPRPPVRRVEIHTEDKERREVRRSSRRNSRHESQDNSIRRDGRTESLRPRTDSTSYLSLGKNGGQTDHCSTASEDEVCERCMKLMEKWENHIPAEEDTSVVSVIHRLRNGVKRRKQQETKEEMEKIMARVSDALIHSGIEGIETDVYVPNRKPFDSTEEKEKISERNFIKDVFKSGQNTIRVRKELILELQAWFDVLRNEWNAICTAADSPEVPSGEEKTEQHYQRILDAFEDSKEAVLKIEGIFQQGLKSAMTKPTDPIQNNNIKGRPVENLMSMTESDDDVDVSPGDSNVSIGGATTTKAEVRSIQGSEIGSGPAHLKRTFEKIGSALQKAMDPRSDPKKHFKTIRKQFKLIGQSFEKREAKIEELQEEIERITKEAAMEKNFAKKQKDEDFRTISTMMDERETMEEKIKTLQEQLRQPGLDPLLHHHPRSGSLYDVFQRERKVEVETPSSDEDRKKDGKGKKKKKKKRITSKRLKRRHTIANNLLPPLMKPASGSSSNPNSATSESETDFDEEEEEESMREEEENKLQIAGLEDQVGQLQKQLHDVKMALSMKDDEIYEMRNQLDVNNSEITTLTDDNAAKDKTIQELESQVKLLTKKLEEQDDLPPWKRPPQQQQTVQPRRESRWDPVPGTNNKPSETTRNAALARMERQHMKEIQTLRDFIEKERYRYKANKRAHDLDHAKVANTIREDNVHTMRALYRFKRVIMRLLSTQDGDIPDAPEETEIELLKSYQEENGGVNLSESAVEVLVGLEAVLSKVLLSKRLEMKDKHKEKVDAVKNMKEYQERLSNTKEICEKQEKLVKMTSEQNTALTNAYQKVLLSNERLSKKLEQQPELLKKYAALPLDPAQEKLITKIQEKHGTPTENESNDENMQKNAVLEPEDTVIKDQSVAAPILQSTSKHKAQFIKNSLNNNQISVVEYHKAQEIIARGASVANQMLARLVHRYMAEHHLKTMTSTLEVYAKKYKSSERFEKYLTLSRQRYAEKIQRLELRKAELRREREDVILRFGEVMEKRFLTIQAYNNTEQLSTMTNKMTISDTLAQHAKQTEVEKMGAVSGQPLKDVTSSQYPGSFWKMQPYVSNRLVRVTVPKLLDMDVNQWKKCLMFNSPRGGKEGRNAFTPSIASLYPYQ